MYFIISIRSYRNIAPFFCLYLYKLLTMIDLIYKIIQTVLNKELRGNITPDEFNKIAKQVQEEIYAEYFGDNNLQQNKHNRGLTNKNYANLPQLVRQKINRFAKSTTLTYDLGSLNFLLPSDLYFIGDNGLMYNSNIIEEVEMSDFGYQSSSIASPSVTFPVYEIYENQQIKVHPSTITDNVTCRYVRTLADPKWTYTQVGDVELFDNTIADFQDFELHPSEFDNIVIRMLSYLGVTIREGDVIQYAEQLKQTEESKEQQ